MRAELVYVGKQGGGPQMPQEEIDRLLVQYGTGDRTVVRLKGGDPFVFGRGGEEALVLRDAASLRGGAGDHRGDRRPRLRGHPGDAPRAGVGVAFVTGHENPDKPETALDWPALAAFPGTLVFYMGVKALPRIAAQLIAGGRPPSEPVAVVERGTLPGQKTVLSTLGEIGVGGGHPRAGDHPGRAGRGAARAARLAGVAAAVRAHRRGDPRAGAGVARSPSGCAVSAPRSSRRPRSAPGRWTVELPACGPTTCCASLRRPAPTGSSRTCATRASSRA